MKLIVKFELTVSDETQTDAAAEKVKAAIEPLAPQNVMVVVSNSRSIPYAEIQTKQE
jgi:hypothetical protein